MRLNPQCAAAMQSFCQITLSSCYNCCCRYLLSVERKIAAGIDCYSLMPGPVSFVHLLSRGQLVTSRGHVMLSRGQQFVVNVGADATLECEFYTDEFNLFDNPILWRKTQLTEQTQMNMMGNLMEPFSTTTRFKVSFEPQPPRYVLALSISGLFSFSPDHWWSHLEQCSM